MNDQDRLTLYELILKLVDGRISDSELTALDALLLDNPMGLELYCRCMLNHGLLRRLSPAALRGQAEATSTCCPQELLDALSGDLSQGPEFVATDQIDPIAPQSDGVSVESIKLEARRRLEEFLAEEERYRHSLRYEKRFTVPNFKKLVRQTVQGLYRGLLLAYKMAVVSAVGLAVVLVFLAGIHAIEGRRVVATLADSKQAQWETAPDGNDLRRGSFYLEQGYALIKFGRGATVVLQSPCEFELCSSNHMFVLSGAICAQVPPSAKGFTVDTLSSQVVDFGTEFGLLAHPNRQNEVHVFKGKVGMRAAQASSESPLQEIEQGQAVLVDSVGELRIRPLEERPRLFKQHMRDDPYQNTTVPRKSWATIGIPLALQAPTIDAHIDDEWSLTPIQHIRTVVGGFVDSPADLSGTWRVLYDNRFLYVLVEINDDHLVNDTPLTWRDDSVEFYFDGRNTKEGPPLVGDNRQYTFGWTTEDVQGTNIEVTGLQHAQVNTATGWRLEFKIPWRSLQGVDPAPGDYLGIDCFLNDDDDGGQSREAQCSTFALHMNDWQNPAGLGTAMLLGGNQATRPFPADKAIVESPWVQLAWTAGRSAKSHRVFMSKDLDEVKRGDPGAMVTDLANNELLVGLPGKPFAQGLQASTTYYWRIDEWNEGNPDSPWEGPVWSFRVP